MSGATLFSPGVIKGAYISPSGFYRYWLSRVWEPEKGKLAFVMLNPSTADASIDDPTIRRCVGFARREGMGGIVVVNLYAGRATEPDNLFKMHDPVGPHNANQWFRWLKLYEGVQTVCAWGADSRARLQAKKFRAFAREHEIKLWRLGDLTKDGSPRHPLYLRSDAPLQPFEAAA